MFPKSPVVRFVHKHFLALKFKKSFDTWDTVKTQFKCNALPCMIIYSPGGIELERIYGAPSAKKLLSRFQKGLRGKNLLKSLIKESSKRPKNILLQAQIGKLLLYQGDKNCRKYLLYVIRNATSKQIKVKQQAHIRLAQSYFFKPFTEVAVGVKILRKYIQLYPKGYFATYAKNEVRRMRSLLRSNARSQKRKK